MTWGDILEANCVLDELARLREIQEKEAASKAKAR
jgi:hypothetical protein